MPCRGFQLQCRALGRNSWVDMQYKGVLKVVSPTVLAPCCFCQQGKWGSKLQSEYGMALYRSVFYSSGLVHYCRPAKPVVSVDMALANSLYAGSLVHARLHHKGIWEVVSHQYSPYLQQRFTAHAWQRRRSDAAAHVPKAGLDDETHFGPRAPRRRKPEWVRWVHIMRRE